MCIRDSFDPEAGFTKKSDDRWEGEDENIKIQEIKVPEKPVEVVPKKSKQERIEEKKAQRRAGDHECEKVSPSVEDQLTEKMRLQKVQEDADLEITKALFEVAGGIDRMNPKTTEEFDAFREALKNKLQPLELSPHNVGFLDNLLRELCVSLDVEDLRRLSSTLTHMGNEKQKSIKSTKQKKKTKATLGSVGKAAKKVDINNIDTFDDLGGEFGDFM